MINNIKLGCDIVNIERVAKIVKQYSDNSLLRIFTSDEIQYAKSATSLSVQHARFAKRFAAKEAFVKACGTGFNGKFFMSEVIVKHTEEKQPYIKLLGDAFKTFSPHFHESNISLSLSDDYPFAMAVVVITCFVE